MNRPTWKTLPLIVSSLTAVVVLAGCSSTKVTSSEKLVTEQLPRPATIWVYDFASSPAEVPTDSVFAGQNFASDAAQTAEETMAGRAAGAAIAARLVEQINGMGLNAALATTDMRTQVNDCLIRGYFLSINEGSGLKRVTIGFGAGASKLETAVEGYQVTAQGVRRLGYGTVQSGSGKTPGASLGVVGLLATANPVGLAVTGASKAYGEISGDSKVEGRAKATAQLIAKELKIRFKERGWIR